MTTWLGKKSGHRNSIPSCYRVSTALAFCPQFPVTFVVQEFPPSVKLLSYFSFRIIPLPCIPLSDGNFPSGQHNGGHGAHIKIFTANSS